MGGFPEREARAPMVAEPVDGCAIRIGRLIVETEEILVREYPHYGGDPGRRFEQPMLVTELLPPGVTPADDARAGELAVHEAPAAYRPGQRITRLEGVRLLERPLGALRGRRLVLRLAENDRTETPRWAQAGATATKATAAASLVGAPSPAGMLGEAIELLRKVDKDDLILIAEVELDAVAALVRPADGAPAVPGGPPPGAARLRFATARRVGLGPAAGQPSAEMVLLVHREPDPGCP